MRSATQNASLAIWAATTACDQSSLRQKSGTSSLPAPQEDSPRHGGVELGVAGVATAASQPQPRSRRRHRHSLLAASPPPTTVTVHPASVPAGLFSSPRASMLPPQPLPPSPPCCRSHRPLRLGRPRPTPSSSTRLVHGLCRWCICRGVSGLCMCLISKETSLRI